MENMHRSSRRQIAKKVGNNKGVVPSDCFEIENQKFFHPDPDGSEDYLMFGIEEDIQLLAGSQCWYIGIDFKYFIILFSCQI